MTERFANELPYVRELIDQAKFGEALEIIEQFENSELLSPEDQLSLLLLKERIYAFTRKHEKQVKISEHAYQLSQDLGLVPESIAALIGKAYIAIIGDLDKASTYVAEAERKLNSLVDESIIKLLRRDLLLIKSFLLFFKRNLNGAAESAQECLELSIKKSNKLNIASASLILGYINLFQGNRTKALDYAMNSLEYNKDLNQGAGLSDDYTLIARIYLNEGDYDQAMLYCKQGLSIKESSARAKLGALQILADIYYTKSEINRSLKYRQRAISFAEESNATDELATNLFFMGYSYLVIGDNEQAVEYLERSLMLSEKWGLLNPMALSLCFLSVAYIRDEYREIANRYFSRLSELYNQTTEKGDVDISIWYLFSKAYMMKTSTRMRDRMEAQALFKELIDRASGDGLIFSIGNLCDLLLEELSMNNDPEILNEIEPLIIKSLEMAETQHNYRWLAETKLLQGKLALIQMNIEEAKQFLTQAQRIAELRGLNLLAQEVSKEHDKLIAQLNDWDNLQKISAPMSERIKLASTTGVLERIQGRRAVEPAESVDEKSTVLLILAEGGILIFSYPFTTEWIIDEDLFSSFLSAFKSFSDEFFSKGLDRVKFGDDMMLMESIGSFSFCYLYKGQTYLARQKLTKFAEKIKHNKVLWQNLEQHYKTSQILDLKENPQLELLITEIFTSKS